MFEKLALSEYNDRIVFIAEDTLIPGISLKKIKDYCLQLFSDEGRAGWYYQQFLKMGVSNYSTISNYYLVWDADTVPLRKLKFFDDKRRTLMVMRKEYHAPYFDTLKKLLLLDRQVDYSFVSEHMMIRKEIMHSLIHAIEVSTINGNGWIEKILHAVNKQEYFSGFSEYETYGNYLAKFYPKSFVGRNIRHRRSAGLISQQPGVLLLKWLSLKYSMASFEKWNKK
ncbi:MAG: DUF6492 family protein [Ferruginibacter sp.]